MHLRVTRLQKKLKQSKLPALLVTHPANIFYLSDFNGTSGVLLVGPDTCDLVTDFRYREQAQKQAPHCRVCPWKETLARSLAPLLEERGLTGLAFEEKHLTCGLYRELAGELKVELVPASGLVEEQRAIKDGAEIWILKRGAAFLDRAFERILKFIRPGRSEQEIALTLEFLLRRMGATEAPFRYIVASGERGAMPHGVASEKKVAPGELLIIDFGAVFSGYATDMTRTVCLGKPDLRQIEIYNVVKEAQRRAAAALKPGMTCKEADAVAREMIKAAGFEQQFGHSLGHGVGLEIHELPRLSPQSDAVLQPGMVVTVEPGIYIPGWGGVRIEDMVLITETGAEVMTHSTRDLITI